MKTLNELFFESNTAEEFSANYIDYLTGLLKQLDYKIIENIIRKFIETNEKGSTIYFIGNGGSASTASHFANDITVGTSINNQTPFKSIRKKTAEHVSFAWTTIPHVTQFDKANITKLNKMMKEYNASNTMGAKLTMTAFAVKAVISALREFPQFNASLDIEKEELIYKQYYCRKWNRIGS